MTGYDYDTSGVLHKYGAFYDEYCGIFNGTQSVEIKARTKGITLKNKNMKKHELEQENFEKFVSGIQDVVNERIQSITDKQKTEALEELYKSEEYKFLITKLYEHKKLLREYNNTHTWKISKLAAIRKSCTEIQKELVQFGLDNNLNVSYEEAARWDAFYFGKDLRYELKQKVLKKVDKSKYITQPKVASVLMTLDWEKMDYEELVDKLYKILGK